MIILKYINGYSTFKRYAVYYFIMIFQIILTVMICCVRQMSFEFGLVWCALDIGEYYLLKKIALRYEKRMRSEYADFGGPYNTVDELDKPVVLSPQLQ